MKTCYCAGQSPLAKQVKGRSESFDPVRSHANALSFVVQVSLSRPPEVTAVGPTALPTMAAAGAVAAGVGVAATAGQSRGDEASEAGSGTSKKSKSSQWKRFKSLFGRKGAKGEPTPSGEERPAPGRDAQQVSKAAIGGQAELPQLERDESDEISWAGSVKEEEPPPGWTESGEGFEGSSSQRASSLGPTTVGEEAEVQSAKQERALARPDQGAAETSGVTSVTHERALELPVEGRTAGVESVRSGAEGFERTPLKAVEGLGVMVESEVEPVKGGVSEQEHESEKPIAKGGDLVMPAAEQSGLAPGEDKEGPTLTEGLSALEKEAAETETARARVSPVEAADGAMRESGNGASERGVTGNVTAQEAQGVATVLSEGEEGLTLAPTSQPSARGPLVTAREGVPRGAAESAGLLGTASLHPPVSATSIPEAASVDSVGANPKVLEDPPSEPTLNTVKGVPVLRGSVSARIRALEQLAAPKVVEGVELGAPKERGLQNLISLQDKSGGQPASGGVDTGAVQSAEVPSKSAESREEPLSGTVPARGSLISGDVENEGIKSAAVAKEGERLTGSGLAEEFAAGKGAVWGELEDDDEVTMESPGRGVMALESVVAMPGDLSQFETAREAGMAESGALMPRNLFPAKTLQDGGKDMGAAASIPEDVSGTMVQDEAGAVAPVPGGLTQALEAKIAPATAISAFGEKGFGQEGAKSTGGRAAPEPGLGLTAAPGRVLESGAGAIEPKQPGYLGGDVIATEIGRKPQDSSLTQRSDSPTEEVNSKPQRPLPQLERSPSPEIPSRWGPRSREPSPVAKRVDVPFASFGGVSNAPQASPRGDAASFGGMPSTLRGAQYSDSGTPTPIPGSFGGVSRAFHEPPLGELRGFSTPTPASTPTTTLVEQSGFPPGAVKAMAKQSPRESAGVPIPGFATPQMRAGAPEPSSFDAGFAKLRINLEAYQSPPDVFNSPRTSKRPPSPAAALPDAAAEKSSVGERPSEQPTEVPAVQAEADPPVSGVEAASEAERSQLEPGLETQSVEEKVEKEVAGRMNKERDVVKTAPAVEVGSRFQSAGNTHANFFSLVCKPELLKIQVLKRLVRPFKKTSFLKAQNIVSRFVTVRLVIGPSHYVVMKWAKGSLKGNKGT